MRPPLYPFQQEALDLLLSQREAHLILVAATGSGKTRIVEEYVRRTEAKTLVLSPLVALSRQHRDRMRGAGIPASHLGDGDEKKSRVWITSPEKLFYSSPSKWERWFRSHPPEFLVCDESHTLTEWGERFRPAFKAIPGWFQEMRFTKSLWMSATLPPGDRIFLKKFLPEESLFEQGRFSLPRSLHISYKKLSVPDRLKRLLQWIEKNGQKGIVFTQTRITTEKLEGFLVKRGIAAVHYHAGLSTEEKMILEGKLQNKDPPLLVATTAFGLGMDLPRLDWVILFQPPLSPTQLAQQLGRVGRGFREGRALVFWDESDFREPWCDPAPFMEVKKILMESRCRTRLLERSMETLERLGEEGERSCGRCDVCDKFNA